MRVLVAGATGVLGRRVVPHLIDQGHEVIGLSRSHQNSEWLSKIGARVGRADLFDLDRLFDISTGAEIVFHLATAIPKRIRTTTRDWLLNDRIRLEGTQNLLEVARANKSQLYLQQSVVFIYGDRDGGWVDEDSPRSENVAPNIESANEMERLVETSDVPWCITRFGTFYSHDSFHTAAILSGVQKGRFPIIGDGNVFRNMINVDDAGGAILRILDRVDRSIGRTFNVVDDQPVIARNLIEYVADLLGAPAPRRVPVILAKIVLGSTVLETLVSSVRVKNDRVKRAVDWRPRYPTFREGMRAEIEKWKRDGA